MTVPSDIEIAQAAKMSPITEVAKKLGKLPPDPVYDPNELLWEQLHVILDSISLLVFPLYFCS